MLKSAIIFAIFCGCGSLANVKISVYYETLCPYSVAFLVQQFYPVYLEHAGHMDVDLIPYGKATANNESGSWVFECQHGEAECYGNKVHSCALDLYSVGLSTEYIVCAMASGNASLDANLEECATSTNISWTALRECLTSGRGDELLAANGVRTDELIPNVVNFIPIVVFDSVLNQNLHRLAIGDFSNTFLYLMDQFRCLSNESNAVFSSKYFVIVSLIILALQKCKI